MEIGGVSCSGLVPKLVEWVSIDMNPPEHRLHRIAVQICCAQISPGEILRLRVAENSIAPLLRRADAILAHSVYASALSAGEVVVECGEKHIDFRVMRCRSCLKRGKLRF